MRSRGCSWCGRPVEEPERVACNGKVALPPGATLCAVCAALTGVAGGGLAALDERTDAAVRSVEAHLAERDQTRERRGPSEACEWCGRPGEMVEVQGADEAVFENPYLCQVCQGLLGYVGHTWAEAVEGSRAAAAAVLSEISERR